MVALKQSSTATTIWFMVEKELTLIIEYLYNSITSGTNSDIYSRYLLTTATTSKWPLYDKFYQAVKEDPKIKVQISYNVRTI